MHANHRESLAAVSVIPNRKAYPVDEARALLGGISRASIYELIAAGQLLTVRIAGRRLVPESSIDAIIAANLDKPADAREVSK